MRPKQITILLMSLLCLPALGGQGEVGTEAVKITQGIEGRVEFWEGDFMPRVFLPDQQNTTGGVVTYPKRQVFVFEKTKTDSFGNTFWTKINSKLVASADSNNNGYFSIQLPEGEYSIVVMENGRYYANLFDGEGNIFPVRVKKNEVVSITFKITYKSTH